jgi:5-methylcytosine-specific restriction endonuclease McrA
VKRGKPLARRTPLLPNPHKVREFQRKLRDPAGREGTSRSASQPLRRSAGKRRPSVPPEVRRRVRARSGGRCIVCAWRGKPRAGKARHLHHVWPVQKFPDLALVEDNLVGACEDCHFSHEYAPDKRIPREALPACVHALYERLPEPARLYFEKTYPLARAAAEPHSA